jgi:hypothetical protein
VRAVKENFFEKEMKVRKESILAVNDTLEVKIL